jgi:integrase/recombinase XerD
MNEEIIKRYNLYRKEAEKISINTVEMQEYHLKGFAEFIGKPFKEATEEDILKFMEGYADNTRDGILATLRKFYQWHYNLDNGDKMPRCIRNIKSTPKRVRDKKEITYRERYIAEDEFQRLIDNATKPMHKAMVETMYRYGVRVSELLSMNATDVSYDGEFTRITARESKTKPRDVIYKGRLNHLMTYVESYQPYKGQKGKPLWVGRGGERFSKRGMLNMVVRISKYAGLKRRINNHDFRHSSITNDLKNGVPTTHVETKHGLVHGSLVIQRYDHNKTKQFEEWLRGNREGKPEETYESIKHTKYRLEAELKAENEQLRKDYDTLQATMEKMQRQLADISLHRQEMVAKEIDKVKRDNRV